MTTRPTPYPPQSGRMGPSVVEITDANGSSRRLWAEQVDTYLLHTRDIYEATHPEERKARLERDAKQSTMANSRQGQSIKWHTSITEQTPYLLRVTARRLAAPFVERKLEARHYKPTEWQSTVGNFLLSEEFGFRNEEEEVLYKATQLPATWWGRLWDSNPLSGVYEISKRSDSE